MLGAPKTPKLTLELGGKAANILFEDAPIDQAIEGVINGIYFNQGHVCCAGSRLFVQEGIYSKVIKKLRDRIQTLRVGNPLDKNTDIGAINSRPQLEKIRELVQSGVDEGAELTQTQCTLPEKGYWFAPSFLTGVTHAHRVASEEIFGPVLSVMTFRTPEEAFERANNIPYGLSAGVWTDKGSKIFKMVNKLRAGVVWANTYNKFDPTSPFGGYKESGFGREGGLHGLGGVLQIGLTIMPVPEFNEIKAPAIQFFADGKLHRLAEVFETLAKHFNLTEAEQNELLPSGTQRRWHNRANWACYDLFRAGLLDRPKKRNICYHRTRQKNRQGKPCCY